MNLLGSSVEHIDVRQFGPLGIGNDSSVFQAAVNSIDSGDHGSIFVPKGAWSVSLCDLNYGTRSVEWVLASGASTTDVTAPRSQILTATNGSVDNVAASPETGDQVDVIHINGSNASTTGEGRLNGINVDLTANTADTGADEPVRLLKGVVRNASTGRGSVKAINVTAVDNNSTNGATALMCYESTITPTAQTTGCRVYSGSISSGAADNVAEGMVLSGNGVAWKNGIRFASAPLGSNSGDNPAFFSAQLASGGATDSWFTKWLDNAGSIVAGVYNTGVTLVQTIRLGNITGGPIILAGAGTPESNVNAPGGSIYTNTNGAASGEYAIYIKRTASGTTGWEGVGTVGT